MKMNGLDGIPAALLSSMMPDADFVCGPRIDIKKWKHGHQIEQRLDEASEKIFYGLLTH